MKYATNVFQINHTHKSIVKQQKEPLRRALNHLNKSIFTGNTLVKNRQ